MVKKLLLLMLLLLITFVVGIFILSSLDADPKTSYGLRELSKSVVLVSGTANEENALIETTAEVKWSGTGFSVLYKNGLTYILTNKHVCEARPNATFTISTIERVSYKASIFSIDPLSDLCVLKTELYVPPVKMEKYNVNMAEEVFVIGAPEGHFPTFVQGRASYFVKVNEPDMKIAQLINAPITHGNSGSPIFDEDGKVVGIIYAVSPQFNMIAYAVPMITIRNFLFNIHLR